MALRISTRACFVFALIAAMTGSGRAQETRRFALRPALLDYGLSFAEPGRVALPLSPTNVNLEVIGWKAAATASNVPGSFVFSFTTPIAAASLISYGVSEAFYRGTNEWKPWPAAGDAGRLLQIRPFPAEGGVEGIKLMVRALPLDTNKAATRFQATLPFATLVPLRTRNIAGLAEVTASFRSSGVKPGVLVDGVIGGQPDFEITRPAPAAAESSPPWLMLSWTNRVSIRGLGFFHANPAAGLADAQIQAYVGEKDPRADDSAWQVPSVMLSSPGEFGDMRMGVITHEMFTRAVRLRATNAASLVGLGEIVVLEGPAMAPVLGKTNAPPSR